MLLNLIQNKYNKISEGPKMEEIKKLYKKLTTPIKYSLILVVYIIVSLLIFSFAIEHQIQKTAADNLKQSLILQANNIEKIIDQQLHALESLSSFASTQETLINNHTINMATSLDDNTLMSKVYIITPDGMAHTSLNQVFDARHRPFFNRSMKGQRVVTRLVSTENDDEYRIVLSVPIYKDKAVIGVVGGSFKLSDVGELIFPSQTFRENGHVFVVNSNGDFIAVDSTEYFRNEKNFFDYFAGAELKNSNFKKIKKELKNGNPDYYILNDNQEKYLAFSPLEVDDWSLGYVIPTTVADAPYQFFSRHELALFGIVILGVTVYLGAIFNLVHREQRKLRRQATYDALTNLYNKKNTEKLIAERLIDYQLKALLIIDLDDFKAVNDQYGHVVGDHFLTTVAQSLKEIFRSYDIVGRIGGDEMMILMDQITNREDVFKKCDEIIAKVSQVQIDESHHYHGSCSIGIAFYPNDDETFEGLYEKADKALYCIKAHGKKGYCEYKKQ